MEIPDVIAINKRERSCGLARRAPTSGRCSRSGPARPPPIVHDGGDERRGRRRAPRLRSRVTGPGSRPPGCSRSGARGTSRPRCSRSPRHAPAVIWKMQCRTTPSLLRLLDQVRHRTLDPLTAVHEILRKVFHIDDEDRPRRSLTSRPRASGSARTRRVTPVYSSESLLRETGRPSRAEGREPPAHGLVQDPRRRQQDGDALDPAERAAGVIAASAGNHGQAVAWAARELGIRGDDLHAAGRADGEGRADAHLRRRGRARRATASTRRSPRRSSASSRRARPSSRRSRTST